RALLCYNQASIIPNNNAPGGFVRAIPHPAGDWVASFARFAPGGRLGGFVRAICARRTTSVASFVAFLSSPRCLLGRHFGRIGFVRYTAHPSPTAILAALASFAIFRMLQARPGRAIGPRLTLRDTMS